MLSRDNLREDKYLENSSDTIEISKDKIIKNLDKRSIFQKNRVFPWISLTFILIYVAIYLFCVYESKSLIDINLYNLKVFKVSTGNDILNGSFVSILSNIFVHRSLWDLVNTIFVIIFCGFFIERYVNRKIILICYFLSAVLFNFISIFLYPENIYCGSFTIVAFLIGMSVYFSYRFKRFMVHIDIYIYAALTFIGFFVSYMVYFYNIVQFIFSYLIGVFVIFILDTKVLRK